MVEQSKKVKLKLVGLDGNDFAVMGAWKGAAKKQGWTSQEISAVLDEATQGDYNHLLSTIMKHTA